MASVLVLTGSPSRVSKTAALARHLADDLVLEGHDVRVVDLRTLPAAPLLAADTSDPAIRAVVEAVISADGVVVATPIYKAAYSGLLKVFLDLLPQRALAGKAVLPVATGGTLAHVLAIDYALRPVLVSLGAQHVTTGRFILDQHVDPNADGHVVVDEETRTCLARTAESFRFALRAAAADLDPVELSAGV